MPKLTTTDLSSSEQRVKEALREDGLLVFFRTKNHRVDYSIMNRPEPTLTQVNDHLLATAIVEAVKTFDFKRRKTKGKLDVPTERDDGRKIIYKQSIDFDWEDKTIVATVGEDLMRQVMAIVVQNLMHTAMREESRKGGLN
jgi:hypothetical protein